MHILSAHISWHVTVQIYEAYSGGARDKEKAEVSQQILVGLRQIT